MIASTLMIDLNGRQELLSALQNYGKLQGFLRRGATGHPFKIVYDNRCRSLSRRVGADNR